MYGIVLELEIYQTIVNNAFLLLLSSELHSLTTDSGFVLHGTRQQGVPAILKELVLPDDSIACHPVS
ncbi:unnamed protein product [Schistosoma curassoni]|uniref:Uncharacterized protein n=1 Tax=Schistosoma curassoni TaxID=6186 RepID=A0A183JLS5_9TREM|nr:unnamed protein product [Schistosoma curassoni]